MRSQSDLDTLDCAEDTKYPSGYAEGQGKNPNYNGEGYNTTFIESSSFHLAIFYSKTGQTARMPKSVDGGELFEDFVGHFPSPIVHQFHFISQE